MPRMCIFSNDGVYIVAVEGPQAKTSDFPILYHVSYENFLQQLPLGDTYKVTKGREVKFHGVEASNLDRVREYHCVTTEQGIQLRRLEGPLWQEAPGDFLEEGENLRRQAFLRSLEGYWPPIIASYAPARLSTMLRFLTPDELEWLLNDQLTRYAFYAVIQSPQTFMSFYFSFVPAHRSAFIRATFDREQKIGVTDELFQTCLGEMLFERSLMAVNDVKDWDSFIENFPTHAHCPRVIKMLLPRLEGMLGTLDVMLNAKLEMPSLLYCPSAIAAIGKTTPLLTFMKKLEEDVGQALADQPAHNEFAQHLGRSQTLFNQLSEKWQESYKDVETAVANMVARL